MAIRVATASLALASLALAAPQDSTAESLHKRYIEERNGITYNMFKRAGQKSTLSYVENSGICVSRPFLLSFQQSSWDAKTG